MTAEDRELAASIAAARADHAAADRVASWRSARRRALVAEVIEVPAGRRWLRGELLARLSPRAAAALARRLLDYREDFAADRRDRTTANVVDALFNSDLRRAAPFLAGSNAATAFWRRAGRSRPGALPGVVQQVLAEGDAPARETTLALLLEDPELAGLLPAAAYAGLLTGALNDTSGQVRALAAEWLAAERPQALLAEPGRFRLDPEERVRMAAWDAAFALEPVGAAEDAASLLADERAPLPARRTALVAIGSALPTGEVAPLLALAVRLPEPALAQDAANLLWSYHRTPAVAEAAARSPHESVRALAQRLLHPESGSPAAGGSRPGAPDSGGDLYDHFRREINRRGERDSGGGRDEPEEPGEPRDQDAR